MINLAIDTGFGRTKALDPEREYDFPSLVAAYKPVKFSTGLESNGDPAAQMAVEYNGRRYFVGTAAAKQGVAMATVDKERTVSE